MSLLMQTMAGSGTNTIVRNSVRVRGAASAYLSRTLGTSTGVSWTFSCWIKRGQLGTNQAFFGARGSGTSSSFYFTTSDQIAIESSEAVQATSTAVFRDISAWYNITIVQNATTVTVYVNNMSVVSWIGVVTYFNTSAVPQYIGTRSGSVPYYIDAYYAELYFIDGQALTPSSFGNYNLTTNVWQPKPYSGTYGNNGFYLPFSDIALTAGSNAGLGKDFSGNGNYYDTTNISLTADQTYDAMVDVPVGVNTGVGNYPVFNTIDGFARAPTFNSGNLIFVGATNVSWARSNVAFPNTGKWYLEARNPAAATTTIIVGLVLNTLNPTTTDNISANAATYGYNVNGNKVVAGVSSAYGATWPLATDVIGIAFDADAGTLTMYKNNVSQGTLATGLTGTYYFVAIDGNATNTRTVSVNFGQQPFTYTPPTGYTALNSFNLPDSTIINGGKYMDATLWTSTGSPQTITNSGFKPDFIWTKRRDLADSHYLTDTNRGISKYISSDTTGADVTDTQWVTAINSNGFSLGTSTYSAGYNIVSWQWQAGMGSTSSNTNGSITSTVSVNQAVGFSIVTYTGTGANATVGHGLGVAPSMIIIKSRSIVQDWQVYHASLGNTSYLQLDTTGASAANVNRWNNTSPTSSVFTIGTAASLNTSAATFVAYCWAEIAGFSKFGSYTGNGSADGPFVYTGFRPKFVLYKNTSAAADWVIWDTSRNPTNVTSLYLVPNTATAEGTAAYINILSNGFKFVAPTDATNNASGNIYVYMAFAENPFKNALAR